MRVVVCGRGAADTRSSVWAHVTASLRAHGYEVITFDPTSPSRSGLVRGDEVASLRKLLVEKRPDLLVHVPTPGDISPSDIRAVTAASETISVALHTGTTFPEAPTRISEVGDHLRDYDLVTVPDVWTAADLADQGGYRLFCLEPGAHAASLDDAVGGHRSGVVIVAEPDDRAAAIARSLVDVGVDLRLYGAGWSEHVDLVEHSFDPLPYSEMGTVLAGASLVVEMPLAVTTQSMLRMSPWEAGLGQCVFDAACVETPSLTLDRPGVAALLEPDEAVLTYRSDADVATLVPMLLADQARLQAVGEAAADQVRATHRWTDRWDDLLRPFVQPDDDGESVVLRPLTAAAPLEGSVPVA